MQLSSVRNYVHQLLRMVCFGMLLNAFPVTDCKSQTATKAPAAKQTTSPARERISLNTGWKFMKYTTEPDKLIYDKRPEIRDRKDDIVADSKPTEAETIKTESNVLKNWILPTANEFINDPAKHHQRPAGNPGSD